MQPNDTSDIISDDSPMESGADAAASEAEAARSNGKPSMLFDRIPFYALLALVFFLPFVFQSALSLSFAKFSLVSFISLILLILLCLKALKRGSFFLPKSAFLGAALAIACVFLVASFFSSSFSVSFFGASFEVGTAVSVILGILLLFLTSRILRTKEQIFGVYIAFFSSLFVVALYQIVRLIGGANVLSFGIFTTTASNLIGKWNEVAIFFGLGALLSLVTLEILRLGKSFRIIATIGLSVSLIFLAVVNFLYVDIVLALFAALFCVYLYRAKKRIAKASLITVIFSLIFIAFYIWGAGLRNDLPARINPAQVEVSPSFTQTMIIAGQTLKSQPHAAKLLFGTGPNFFQNEWFLLKPSAVNESLFWSTDFSYGIGLLPTYAVTTGILGIIAWLLFIALFLWLGWKSLFSGLKPKDVAADPTNLASRYLPLSSFLAALFLWIFNIIYTPSAVIYALTFIFTGIFVASLYEEGKINGSEIFYIKKKFNLLTVFVLVIAMIAALALIFVTGEKVAAAIDVNNGIISANQNTPTAIAAAQSDLKKAIALDAQPTYYRTLAQIDLAQADAIINQQNVPSATLISQFQPVWNDAVANVEKAQAADPGDYQSELMLGNMYASALSLGYPDAYSLANTAYQAALKTDPTNPAILLALAQLEVANKNISGAADDISKALQEKPNYSDAIYLMAQIQVSQNDIAGATQSMTVLSQLNPTDPTVFYELGYLDYSAQNYAAAIQALQQAVSLESDYSNARYFLGLSYYKENRVSDAITQFNDILQLNPGNQSVESILANLRAGKAPLSDETAATDQTAANQKLKNQPGAQSSQSAPQVSNSAGQTSATAKTSPFSSN